MSQALNPTPPLSDGLPEIESALPDNRPLSTSVPPSALAISLGALGVALLAAVFSPKGGEDVRALQWILALVPALLLAHHRRWKLVTLLLALGMVAFATVPAVALALGHPIVDWPFSLSVLAAYIAIALGGGWLSEVRTAMTRLEATQAHLRNAYGELARSHEELQQTHLQMIRADQMDATGRLAAGIAHEVKNPLMTLLTGVQYLKAYGKVDGQRERTLLDDMWVAVKRADSVVRGLLDLSRQQELVWKRVVPNDLVERTLGLVKHEIQRRRIALVRDLAPDLPDIVADGYRIQQVLINLMTNAAQAMGEGGTLTVLTGRSVDPQGVLITVEDTGPGIPERVLGHVFEAFFTTKGREHGTGLGLAVAKQIVRMHGGSLQLENGPEGARAVVLLPLQPPGVERVGEEAHIAG